MREDRPSPPARFPCIVMSLSTQCHHHVMLPMTLGSIRKVPYPELKFNQTETLKNEHQLQGMRTRRGRRSLSTQKASILEGGYGPAENCPLNNRFLGRPPFDLMVFVSPEWNVSLVKAIMDWVRGHSTTSNRGGLR